MDIDTATLPTISKHLTVNGVAVSGEILVQLLNMITSPDPRVWYRFVKREGIITVYSHAGLKPPL